jgi:hypothetical protein
LLASFTRPPAVSAWHHDPAGVRQAQQRVLAVLVVGLEGARQLPARGQCQRDEKGER